MLIQHYDKILVVTDGQRSSEPTHQTGLNLAQTHQASVTIADTIQLPGALTYWFSPNATHLFEMVLADKQERLEKLAATFRAAGIETETKVLFGKSSETISKEVIESEISLVVRYAKGIRSKFPGRVGNTARALMRYCPAPILLVNQNPIDQPRILACLDAEHDEKENYSIMTESRRLAGGREHLFGMYCWEMYGEEMVKKRMNPEAFGESWQYTEKMYRKVFDEMVDKIDADLFLKDSIMMKNGQASLVIPKFCSENNIDVVTMCTATLNHPLRRYFGSTVEAVLEKLPCALLAVKPVGFVSPLNVEPVVSTAR